MPGRGEYGNRESKKPKKGLKKGGPPMLGGTAPAPAEVQIVKTKGKKAKADW